MRKEYVAAVIATCLALPVHADLTRAEQSFFNAHPDWSNTSQNLSKADLAWHAVNTFGFNCPEVIKEKRILGSHHSIIICNTGTRVRVHPVINDKPLMTLVVNQF
ncbi:hypothetical protein IQ22_00663 [Pseudomonas duriflava]|uniref:Uncharacterized protein n=1 Tax=Pseudomonas duriflava TaxID=459528 RepID=A0A562QL09_9PSED|nr:hypothetical protein [Pseudomonas duriflava]TWI57447.1 hypothetical protein IQ22_00663 [Pseudomonas duriflava]